MTVVAQAQQQYNNYSFIIYPNILQLDILCDNREFNNL